MSSLIANFFKRNVTLNMGATVESSPQTAFSQLERMPYSEWKRYFEGDTSSYRDKVLGSWGDARWKIARPEPRGAWNLPRGEYMSPTGPCPYCLNDGIDTGGKMCKHWNGMGWTKNPPENRYPTRDFSVDISLNTSKLDEALRSAMEKLQREQILRVYGVNKDDLLGESPDEDLEEKNG